MNIVENKFSSERGKLESQSNNEFRMPEIIEKYTAIIMAKGLTKGASTKAAEMIYEQLFIEPTSQGRHWYNHDAAEAFIPALRLMNWKWFKALVRDRLPAIAELPTIEEVDAVDQQVVPCPRCSKPTAKVEIVYPSGWGEPEVKVPAWTCPHCRYVFAESDIDYIKSK